MGEHMKKTIIIKEILLVLVTLIWGMGFIAQANGGKNIDSFTFNLSRNIIASLFLFSVCLISYFIKKKKGIYKKDENIKELLFSGILMGIFLFLGMSFQQIGINSEGAGKSGFLTALYVIIVPIIEIIFTKQVKIHVLISALLALVGLYFINSGSGSFDMNFGSIMLILCAFSYSGQIMVISRYSDKHDTFVLSFLQFFTATILLIPCVIFFGSSSIEAIRSSILDVLFLGIVSSGIAYTLQVYSQKEVNVTVSSIIMSLESVFSLIFGVIFLSESHTFIEYMGCLLIFVGVILSQIPMNKLTKSMKK